MAKTQKTFVTWEGYDELRQEYGHVGTWALWPNDFTSQYKNLTIEEERHLRAKTIVATTAAEYRAYRELINGELSTTLHANVVLLALNFSNPIKDEKKLSDDPYDLASILYKHRDDAAARYQALREAGSIYPFTNIWGAAGHGKRVGLGYYEGSAAKQSWLNGAYITDFIKIDETDTGEAVAAGIAESNSNAELVKKYLRGDLLQLQVEGLHKELDLLCKDSGGASRLLEIRPDFILCHSGLSNRKRVKTAIAQELGYEPNFYKLEHYSYYSKPKNSKSMTQQIHEIDAAINAAR